MDCILDVFVVFAEQACQLGERLCWPTDRVKRECLRFLTSLTSEVLAEKGHYAGTYYRGHLIHISDLTSNIDGSILPAVMDEFQQSNQ